MGCGPSSKPATNEFNERAKHTDRQDEASEQGSSKRINKIQFNVDDNDEDEMLPSERQNKLLSFSASESSKSPDDKSGKLSSVGCMPPSTPGRMVKTKSGRSLVRLDPTSKFSAFNVRTKIPPPPASSSRHSATVPFRPLLKKLSERNLTTQQSTRMIGNLRNTLNRLNTIQASPVKKPQLLRLDSTGNFQQCSNCSHQHIKGLMCEKGHFTCIDCFKPLVEAMCKDAQQLKNEKFAIGCPIEGCESKEWNTYHVRKVLDGPTLELYIDTLVRVCRADELDAAHAKAEASTAEVFTGGEKYLPETMEILRQQIRKLGLVPMEYIPLAEIRQELQTIFDKLNNDEPYDEKRMDFLLLCMENNPLYIAEKEAEAKKWRDDMAIFTTECLDTMRGYIPPHIFEATLDSLQEEDGLPKELAKRIMNKKCLWLIRMNIIDIEKIHEVELMGRFNPVAQQLDIVELAAIYACIPDKFLNDPSGRKTEWRTNLENALKDMDKLRQSGSLLGSKARNMVYKKMKMPAPFINRKTVRTMEVTQGIQDE